LLRRASGAPPACLHPYQHLEHPWRDWQPHVEVRVRTSPQQQGPSVHVIVMTHFASRLLVQKQPINSGVIAAPPMKLGKHGSLSVPVLVVAAPQHTWTMGQQPSVHVISHRCWKLLQHYCLRHASYYIW
jgi:hypothetical protein